jgi:di/tricarboxylate transporter
MDPNRKEKLDVYEHNARVMYYVGFALVPLAWLMCWIYSSRRRKESEYLDRLSRKAFILWWIGVLVFGIWTLIYHAYWYKMTGIAFNLPDGEIQ